MAIKPITPHFLPVITMNTPFYYPIMRLLTSSRAWSKGGTPGPDSAAEYTSFNNFIKEIVVEGIQVELVIWDNTGMDGYEKLRRLSYEDVHVVLLCFDISDQDSFDNLRHLVSTRQGPAFHLRTNMQ